MTLMLMLIPSQIVRDHFPSKFLALFAFYREIPSKFVEDRVDVREITISAKVTTGASISNDFLE